MVAFGKAGMPIYQVYFLDADDQVRHTHDLDCETDDDVIARVQRMDWSGFGVEIWQAERLVRRFEPLPP